MGSKRRIPVFGILVCLIVLFALVLRVSCFDVQTPYRPYSDGMTYDHVARNILKYGVMTHDPDGAILRGEKPLEIKTTVAVGYPLFLAMLYSILPSTLEMVFAVNLCLSMCTLLLIGLIMKRLSFSKPAMLAGLLIAGIYPAFIYMNNCLLTENLYMPLCLAAVYALLRGTGKEGFSERWVIAGFAFLSLASTVRAQCLLLFVLFGAYVLFLKEAPKSKKIRAVIAGFAALLVVYIPIWIWLYGQSGRFVLYPRSERNTPRIWGVQPYFIDMASAISEPTDALEQANIAANPSVYYRWRIFGFIQKMWWELWDEFIVHPFEILRPLHLMQQLIIVPAFALIPAFMGRMRKDMLLIAAIPYIITFSCFQFHGLPRYVILAVPFVIMFAAYELERLAALLCRRCRTCSGGRGSRAVSLVSAGAGLFSLCLVFSVYLFPGSIDTEQSQFRLARYMSTSIDEAESRPAQYTEVLNQDDIGSRIQMVNVLSREDGSLQGVQGAMALMHIALDSCSTDEEMRVVTKVTLDVKSSQMFDTMTIYWKSEELTEYSESCVYSIPKNPWSSVSDIYIDGDVTELRIVPTVTQEAVFSLGDIGIKKFVLHP